MLRPRAGMALSCEAGSSTPKVPLRKPTSLSASPTLSVVVLTHNRRRLLRDCLESLFAQDESGKPFEILVVDDGSSDGTGGLVLDLASSHPELTYVFQPHGGIAAARNQGIRHASGEIVAFVADDYLLAPDYVRSILSFFLRNPEALVVRFKITAAGDDLASRVCHAYNEASVNRRLVEGWAWTVFRLPWRLIRPEERITADHDLEAAGGAAFRREVFQRVGLFDETFLRAEDTDYTRRLRAQGIAVYYYPYHSVRHRYHRRLGAALKSAFHSGRYRWRYRIKYWEASTSVFSLLFQGLTIKLSSLYWAFWRARQTGALEKFVLYLPFLLLLELSTKAGFFVEGVIRGKVAATAPAPPPG